LSRQFKKAGSVKNEDSKNPKRKHKRSLWIRNIFRKNPYIKSIGIKDSKRVMRNKQTENTKTNKQKILFFHHP